MALYHNVYFQLKTEVDEQQREAFSRALRTLIEKIPFVMSGEVGVPAPIEREVVVKDYDFALLLLFADLADHDAYQTHPLHQDFVSTYRNYWEKVTVYDSAVLLFPTNS